MIIDANMYWFPEEIFSNNELLKRFLSEIPASSNIFGYEKGGGKNEFKQVVIEKPKGFQNLNYFQNDYILENQLADMDRAGVDRAVLKLPGCQEWLGLELCKQFNTGLFKHAQRSDRRMTALGVVPPIGSPECIHEVERCIKELGMGGIQLSTHYGSAYLDDIAFAPFFTKLNQMGLTIYIHHSPVPVQYDSIYEFNNLRRQFGRCVDQATAVGRELFSGFFDRYPNLKFVHSMLGGGFFTYYNMMLPKAPKIDETTNRFDSESESIRKHLKNNLFFEMSQAQSWGKDQLECAVSVLGADHILFGTSYPVRKEWLLDGANFVKQLEISDAEKDLLLYKNAELLYKA